MAMDEGTESQPIFEAASKKKLQSSILLSYCNQRKLT